MKQFWVDCRPWNKECATTAIESGADAIVAERAGDVKRLGRITTVAPDGDLVYGKDVIECTITDKASENEAAQKGKDRIVIVTTSDWTVIPLENLVAQSDRIIAAVKTSTRQSSPCMSWRKACTGSSSKPPTPRL